MTNNIDKEAMYRYGNTLHHARNVSNQRSSDPLMKAQSEKLNQELDKIESQVKRPIVSSKSTEQSIKNRSEDFKVQYRDAFIEYLKKGNENLLQQVIKEAKDSGIVKADTMQTSNGYSITDTMSSILNDYLQKNSPIRKFAKCINSSRDVIDSAAYVNQITYAWGDATTVAPVTDAFVRKTIRVYDLTAQPQVTQRMVDDPDLDIETWLAELIVGTFLEQENLAFLNGTGLNQPTGILTYPSGKGSGQIERIYNGSNTALSIQGLLALQAALNVRYENNGEICFIASKTIISQIRTLQDPTGRYIWTSGVLESGEDMLFGVPLLATNAISTVAPNSDIMVYGNLKQGYQIIDRSDIKIQRDPFSAKPYVIYFVTKTLGADVMDYNAIKVLNMS